MIGGVLGQKIVKQAVVVQALGDLDAKQAVAVLVADEVGQAVNQQRRADDDKEQRRKQSVSSCCRKKDVPQNGLRALNNGVTLFCRAGNAAA